MFNQIKLPHKLYIILSFFLITNFCSCGFAVEKRITGKYYIIAVDIREDIGLSYQLSSGDYIGKAPGRLLQYGYNDIFLVAKTQENKNNNPAFYIIDMTKDSELALEKTFRIGPLTEEKYNRLWKHKLNIQLIAVK